ncbi:baseplate J/gp47 family protein [Pseudomonas sp. GV071]|uniref:baseplate J/gp47 family protein n=1 Tax=Pseudomonas sp. GV071 TaxID=2135754 RepID=UPI000D3D463F|nr:baseplate J/gp47 family protein [Pseudomonas sp. GV071]PTQ70284.1 baseplate J-like protein [Pseudomonas sp. GV071]
MAFTTSVPDLQLDRSGITLPAESAILAGVQADINTAFGGGVNPGLSSPQGQLAQTLTAIIGDKNDRFAEVVNQLDPDKASGRWQDALGRIYFIDRIAASGTVVTGTCSGLVGTLIPAGSVAQDVNGYLYLSQSDARIGADGSVQVDFQCTTSGPIACPVGALTRIFQQVIGWDTVINHTAGSEGVEVENRTDFEYRRKLSVAANAVNSVQSVYAAVLDVDGVLDAYVIDNPKSTEVLTGVTHYPVAANSIYVAVVGGEAADIAQAIWSKKSNGCNYNGETVAVVEDLNYTAPRPSYRVSWVTPTAVPVFFSIQIAANAALPATIKSLIQQAVIDAFNGTDGGARARIASAIYAGRFYAGVAATDANVQILSILLGSSAPAGGISLVMGIDQRPTLDISNIDVQLVG